MFKLFLLLPSIKFADIEISETMLVIGHVMCTVSW